MEREEPQTTPLLMQVQEEDGTQELPTDKAGEGCAGGHHPQTFDISVGVSFLPNKKCLCGE